MVEILNHTFYFAHGEDVLPLSPYSAKGGMNTKFRMDAIVGEILNYMCIAHWHTYTALERELAGRMMVNGSFVGPTLYSVKRFHEAVLPFQLIFAVHPKWGVTHQTNLYLASVDEVRKIHVYGRND